MTLINASELPGEESRDPVLRRAARGDERACRTVYEAHAPRVRALALQMSDDESDADDLTQEVFIEAFRSLPGFRGESAFATWLHQIAVRVIWRGLRSRRRGLWLPLDGIPEPLSAEDRPHERIDLQAGIAALPPGARAILVLHEVDGLRYAEIAERLDLSLGTVKSQLHRARSLLMEYLR